MQALTDQLAVIAACPGLLGTALVERDSGMVWCTSSDRSDMERVAEAAVEFFRSPDRLRFELEQFGPVSSVAYSFQDVVIGLHPCHTPDDLVLVSLADKQQVRWGDVAEPYRALCKLLRERHA